MWNFEKYKGKIALYDDYGNSMTYTELVNYKCILSTYFSRKELIVCLCSNSIEAIAGYLSFIELGMVPILLEKTISKWKLQKIIDAYKPKYIWGTIEKIENYACVFKGTEYRLLYGNHKDYLINKEVALLVPTSGSTGSEKMVSLSYDNILSNATAIIQYLGITQDDRPVTSLPMNYVYGLSVIHSHCLVGATILVTSKSIIQKSFWDFVEKVGATSFSGVPFSYELLRKTNYLKRNIPQLTTFTQAGGKLSDELQIYLSYYMKKHSKKFYIMYGQSEATARISYLDPAFCDKKIGSIGKVIPNGLLWLENDEHIQITQPYVQGELVYEGPNVMLGYVYNFSDLAISHHSTSILRTGDMAYADNEGFFYITNRIKRIVKINGVRIGLDELERELSLNYGIDIYCIAYDEKLAVCIPSTVSKDSLTVLLEKNYNIISKDHQIYSLDYIPRNANGKVKYSELEKMIYSLNTKTMI